MAAGAPETKTTIDSLVELLKKRGKMDLNTISTALGVDTAVVENWAKVLEKGNVVRITYEVGKMFVSPSTLTPEQEATEKARLEAKTVTLEAEAGTQLISLDKFTEALLSIKTSVAEAERMEATQIPEVRKAISELNNIYALIEQRNRGLEQMAKRAAEVYDEVNKKATELGQRINSLESGDQLKKVEDVKQTATQISKNISSIDSDIALVGKNASDALSQVKKGIESQTKTIAQQVDENKRKIDANLKEYAAKVALIERQLKERARSMETSLGDMNEFSKDKERESRKLRDARVEFNNQYTKMSEEMLAQRTSIEALSKDLLGKIDRLKAGFGDAAALEDTIATIKSQIGSLESEIAQARQQVSETQTQLRALTSISSSMTTEERMATVSNIEKRSKSSASKISGIKEKAEKTTTAMKKLVKGEK